MPKISKGKQSSRKATSDFRPGTVGYILNAYKPPALLVNQFRSSSNTTCSAHPRKEFRSISGWTSFEEDLSPYRNYINTKLNLPLMETYQPSGATRAYSEKSIEAALSTHIFDAFHAIIKTFGSDFYFRESIGLSHAVRFNPDIVLIDADQTNPICCVQVKTPWALDFGGVNVIDRWNEELKLKDDYKKKLQNAVIQLHAYISYNHMKHGILTTYDHFVFVRRMPDSILQISQPVPAATCLKRLVEFFYLILEDPFYGSPKGSPIEELTGRCRRLNKGKTYEIVRLQPGQFCFSQTVGSTKYGSVVKGAVSGYGGVVFKVKDIGKEHGIANALAAEARLYGKMQRIQGKFIPRCLGLVDLNGFFFALVLEDCGPALTAEDARKPEVRNKILNCLKAIHSCGILHGDLVLRNVCYDRAKQAIRIIDFNHSRVCADKALLNSEVESIEFLGEDDS